MVPVPCPSPRPLALVPTSLAIRWLHVVAATVVVGGSLTTWFLLRVDGSAARIDAVAVARSYEWCFWAAVGTLVLTGVGNLGAFAPALPAGRWRATLDAKLGLFVLALGGSALRATLLSRLTAARPPTTTRRLRVAYGATAVGFGALLTLAVVLAHG